MARSRKPTAGASRTGSTSPDANAARTLQTAVARFRSRELDAAMEALDTHLRLVPDSWTGLCLKAVLAAETHREAEAEVLWLQLVQRDPSYVDGHVNLGLMYRRTGRLDDAEKHLRLALKAQPDHRGAHHNLGLVLMDRGGYDEAQAEFEFVCRVAPQDPQPHFCLGVLWQNRLDFDRACEAYREALRLHPSHPGALNNLLFCLQYLASCPSEVRLSEARTVGAAMSAGVSPRTRWRGAFDASRPLRVGLVSGDLRAHPVGFFLLPLVESLDAPDISLHAYSNFATEDTVSDRLRARCATWHRVDTWSDDALAQRIADDGIDILIDLAGHSALNRLPVFARKPAPVLVSWLGYFATTGLPAMDWVLADPVCVPTAETGLFTERIAHLPVTRLCFSPPDGSPAVSPPPAASRPQFTFGSFQDLAKINDEVLALWAKVLAACPHAVLRIQSARVRDEDPRERFIRRALSAGLPAGRLSLHGPVSRDEYLASHADVDVILDTFPYPGGTTTCEALWMGVPTLTLARPGMLARQGEGLLTAAGLQDWIARSPEAYLTKAIRCASPDPRVRAGLAELRAGLRAHLVTTPLFDGARFARDWARVIREIWRIECGRRADGGAIR